MFDLDNLEEIKKLDSKNVYESTGMLADQCEQIWSEAKNLNFPPDYQEIKNMVICGMGGSAFGGYVAKALYSEELSIPLNVNSDYELPNYVNQESLVILDSYSGTTEETLSCAHQALERKAKITGLTIGAELAEFLRNNRLPALIFNPRFNPSGQQRLGTGYTIFGIMGILNQLGLIKIDTNAIKIAVDELRKRQEVIKQAAINLSKIIQGSIPLVFAAEFLGSNAHIIRNQFNETAKSFSTYSQLPELNHHLMEGLKNPKDKKLVVLIINSRFYSENIKKRVKLTREVIEKNGIKVVEYLAEESSKISQMLNVLSFGGWLTFYLAILYGQDPSLIPWVDYFKKELGKSS